MKQEIIEKLALTRQLEIINNPKVITKTFDVHHLKSIHAYLFQDSQKDRCAGQFRLPKNDVHAKNRPTTYFLNKPFYYEPAPSENKVNAIIKQANAQLSLPTSLHSKTEILSHLYAHLDYEHPFVEGNSRTIRIFLEHLAQKHGIKLNWQHTAENKEELYRARDFEIAKRNQTLKPTTDIEAYMLEEAKRYNTKAYIAVQIAMHNGRTLWQIIKDCCSEQNKTLNKASKTQER